MPRPCDISAPACGCPPLRALIAIPHRPCLLSRRPSISPGLAFQQQPILPSGKEPSWQLVQDCEVMTQFSSKSNWEGTCRGAETGGPDPSSGPAGAALNFRDGRPSSPQRLFTRHRLGCFLWETQNDNS